MAGPLNSRFYAALTVCIVFCFVFCDANEISREDYLEMKNYLEFINRPGVKIIETEEGDLFDCVDINNQPAFDHPSLRNHTIQMEPASFPDWINGKPSNYSTMKTGLADGGCPIGTVPIRRLQIEELLKAGSVSNLLNKYGKSGHRLDRLKAAGPQYAIASLSGGLYRGIESTINVWKPVVKSGGSSAAQLWVMNGPNDNINVIEAGWIVIPDAYGNNAPHLFIYWTGDGYRHTGCYNLQCPGFVQVSRSIVPGMILRKTSSIGGIQEDITLLVSWDAGTKSWWLGYHETNSSSLTWVGYWPGSLFKYLVGSSNRLYWGGVVVRDTTGTYPQMGSGRFPSEGLGKAAYIKKVLYLNTSVVPGDVELIQTCPSCFKIQDMGTGSPAFGRYFLFGGPGGHCTCNPRPFTSTEDASE